MAKSKDAVTMTEMLGRAWKLVFSGEVEGLDEIPIEYLNKPARKMPHNTMLLWAVMDGKWDVAKKLVELGCNVVSQNDYGQSPLGEWILARGGKEDLSFLWDEEVNIGSKSVLPKDVLTSAISAESMTWIKKAEKGSWLMKGVTAEVRPDEPPEWAVLSAEEWNTYRVQATSIPSLLTGGVELSFFAKDEQKKWVKGSVPLEYAAIGVNDLEVLAWLKNNRVETNLEAIPFNWRIIYILHALQRGDAKKLCALLEVEPKAEIMNDFTLLTYFCVCELLNNDKFAAMDSVLEMAKKKLPGNEEMLFARHKYIEEKKPDTPSYFPPQVRDYHPVFKMVYLIARLESVKYPPVGTVYLPADGELEKNERSMEKLVGRMNALFDRGMSPDFRERGWGWNLIHSAAACGSEIVTRMLLERGVDIKATTGSPKSKKKKTARDVAIEKGHVRVLSLLEAAELKNAYGAEAQQKPKAVSAL